MNKEVLKSALLKGALTGIATWIVYGLVFEMLINGESFKDALFSKGSLIFLAVIVVVEIVLYYFTLLKGKK